MKTGAAADNLRHEAQKGDDNANEEGGAEDDKKQASEHWGIQISSHKIQFFLIY